MATTDLNSQNSGTQSEVQNPFNSLITLSIPISIKLTQTNFLTWKSQILPIIRGHKLISYIEPPQDSSFLTAANQELSDAAIHHQCQDQLLLGWIRSSLTETIQAQVVS